MQDVVISREMLREWGGRARQRWSDEAFEKDLNEKLVFADNGEFFPGAPFLIPMVVRWNRRFSITSTHRS